MRGYKYCGWNIYSGVYLGDLEYTIDEWYVPHSKIDVNSSEGAHRLNFTVIYVADAATQNPSDTDGEESINCTVAKHSIGWKEGKRINGQSGGHSVSSPAGISTA
jgi:hypothetical protein